MADPKVASEVAVILLDVSMPGMARSEIRSRLRELAPQARVICFTGHAVEALDGDPVLEKPVSNEALLAKVRSVLDQPAEHG
jgi:FixJ family two-component response regulator